MKKVFKIGCLGIIGLFVLIIIAAVAFGGGEESASTPTETAVPAEEATETEATEESAVEEGTLTAEKFDQIQSGMTYEEVVGIIGSEGQVMSESGDVGTDFHTVIYEWETDAMLSSANFTFQGGKLMNKTQIGISETEGPEVTIEQFNTISNGMTTEEVFAIVGGEGEILSETGDPGTDLHTIMYSYDGANGLGANASFMFQGDKLQNKSQFGLE